MSTRYPIDLLVRTSLHKIAESIESAPKFIAASIAANRHGQGELHDSIARRLLGEIALRASTPQLLVALAAVGAPGTLQAIGEAYDEVTRQRAAEGLTLPPREQDGILGALGSLFTTAGESFAKAAAEPQPEAPPAGSVATASAADTASHELASPPAPDAVATDAPADPAPASEPQSAAA